MYLERQRILQEKVLEEERKKAARIKKKARELQESDTYMGLVADREGG
jgi:hypothetical protein